jgi:hypothetical protein
MQHSEFILGHLLPAFDVAAASDLNANNEIAQQLWVSTKMYRHGRTARDNQMQFLSKFTALEGLVCGSRTGGHGHLLKKHLPALFKARLSEARVDKLWKLRCRASHQGTGSWHDFAAAIPDVDILTVGCTIFATDHLGTLKRIDELWKRAHVYQLPPKLFDGVWGSNAIQRFEQKLGWLSSKIFPVDWPMS